ncbi:MAG TPA: MFS transporter [Chitinophagales bacterium]|nr:MFS transporter [Chitinophagales bacterium]HMW13064.1 MFS transporter [Chitinophagales bacterium]HMX60652.1 MFS transporter [Chitinophagales bacterium]HMY22482.1 MFS transporter [Chitinophagales bacterium]HMZ34374.1 MFS transporter [Chitinophagales bacterium]
MSTPKKDPYIALRYKEFRAYVLARFLITIAVTMQAIIIGYEIYELTNSKLLLGFIGLAEAIPAIGNALYGGYIADKSDKRTMLVMFVGIYTILCATLLFFTHTSMIASIGKDNVVIIIFVIIFLTGIARSFSGPASFGLAAQIVPRDVYQSAITWSSSAWQLGAVLGPGIGGLLLGILGITHTLSIIVIILSIAVLAILYIEKKPVQFVPQNESVVESALQGLKFVFHNKVILSCITLDLFAVLFGGAIALLPVYAKDILHVGAEGLGFLRAAQAIGAIIMLMYLAYFPIKKNAGIILLLAVFGFGVFIILFGISKIFWFSMFCLMMSGALDGISVSIRHTIVQLSTPDEMRGRVSAVNSMFIGSSNEIGEFESGATAAAMGTVPAVIFGGCMTCLVVIVTYFISPSIRKMELNDAT